MASNRADRIKIPSRVILENESEQINRFWRTVEKVLKLKTTSNVDTLNSCIDSVRHCYKEVADIGTPSKEVTLTANQIVEEIHERLLDCGVSESSRSLTSKHSKVEVKKGVSGSMHSKPESKTFPENRHGSSTRSLPEYSLSECKRRLAVAKSILVPKPTQTLTTSEYSVKLEELRIKKETTIQNQDVNTHKNIVTESLRSLEKIGAIHDSRRSLPIPNHSARSSLSGCLDSGRRDVLTANRSQQLSNHTRSCTSSETSKRQYTHIQQEQLRARLEELECARAQKDYEKRERSREHEMIEHRETMIRQQMLQEEDALREHLQVPNDVQQQWHNNPQQHYNTRQSDRSDFVQLADAITQSMQLSRLPVAKPSIFNGNVLEYRPWRVAFDMLITQKQLAAREKLLYLKEYTGPKVHKLIAGVDYLDSEDAFIVAIKNLDKRYGDDIFVADGFRNKLADFNTLKANDYAGLQEYADLLSQIEIAYHCIEGLHVLDDIKEIIKLSKKLPDHTIRKWATRMYVLKIEQGRQP